MKKSYMSIIMLTAIAIFAASCSASESTETGSVDVIGETGSIDSSDSNSVADTQNSGDSPSDNILAGIDREVINLQTGETVKISDYISGDKPVLVWSFAPYCGVCQGEAPKINAFAKENVEDLDVIGIGSINSLEEAQAFKDNAGYEGTILWSQDSTIWSEVFGDTISIPYPNARVLSGDLQLASETTYRVDFNKVRNTMEKLS